MKVYIGPYKNWFGPYQLAELLCFWVKNEKDEDGFKSKPDWVHNFGEWLAYGSAKKPETFSLGKDPREPTLLYKFLLWLEEKRTRKVYIKIDKYDTWSMDRTLGMLVLPMLKQLRATKHGAPLVDDEDVPEELRSTSAEPKENEWDTDSNHFKRWDWIMDEMIWAFEQLNDENHDNKFYTGEYDLRSEPCEWDEKGKPKLYKMVEGPNHTAVFDIEGSKKHEERIQRGLVFFGKYYRSLWD